MIQAIQRSRNGADPITIWSESGQGIPTRYEATRDRAGVSVKPKACTHLTIPTATLSITPRKPTRRVPKHVPAADQPNNQSLLW